MTSLLKVFDVAASAMTAQSQRLNVVASNLANADSASGPDGKAYKAKQVVFSTQDMGGAENAGVRVTGVIDDPSPMKRPQSSSWHSGIDGLPSDPHPSCSASLRPCQSGSLPTRPPTATPISPSPSNNPSKAIKEGSQ